MFLTSLKEQYFHQAIPELPMGKYAHIVVLRETNSFPLFQTDGELNTAYVSAGWRTEQKPIARIVMFKRKQISAERLHGRELLRRYDLISAEGDPKKNENQPFFCEYNSANFCKRCPDCIFYGFAIGNAGSERAKVLSDSAFSLTSFDISHQTLTFNAPFENGTMSRQGQTRSSIGEQDHVLPQVFFPAVVTLKDPTEAEFIYVLNNVLRASRYGAQTTRTGTVDNHLVGLVFANGEGFSNLRLTQAMYDDPNLKVAEAQMGRPLELNAVLQAAKSSLANLLEADGLVYELVEAEAVLAEMQSLTRDENRLRAVLNEAADQANRYALAYGAFSSKTKKGKA